MDAGANNFTDRGRESGQITTPPYSSGIPEEKASAALCRAQQKKRRRCMASPKSDRQYWRATAKAGFSSVMTSCDQSQVVPPRSPRRWNTHGGGGQLREVKVWHAGEKDKPTSEYVAVCDLVTRWRKAVNGKNCSCLSGYGRFLTVLAILSSNVILVVLQVNF